MIAIGELLVLLAVVVGAALLALVAAGLMLIVVLGALSGLPDRAESSRTTELRANPLDEETSPDSGGSTSGLRRPAPLETVVLPPPLVELTVQSELVPELGELRVR